MLSQISVISRTCFRQTVAGSYYSYLKLHRIFNNVVCYLGSIINELGLLGKAFVVGGSEEVPSVRGHQKLFPCQAEPVLDSSNRDLLLAKTEPSSDVRTVSVTAHSKKDKRCCRIATEMEVVENVRETI